jgi:hypothetical protein
MTVLAFVCKAKLTFNNINGESLSRDGIAEHLFQLSDVWGFKCFIQASEGVKFNAPAATAGAIWSPIIPAAGVISAAFLAFFLVFAASDDTG